MTASDTIRISLNVVFAAAQIASAFILFREGFETASGPYPKTEPSPIVPAGYAFIIWTPIFLGSLAYAVIQALPQYQTAALFREIGWLTAIAFLACLLWNLAAKFGPVMATVPLILLMFISLIAAAAIAASSQNALSGTVYWLGVAPLMLYAGWLTVAVFANAAEVLPEYGFQPLQSGETAWTLALLGGASCVAALGLWLTGGNIVYAGAILWALVAIAVVNFGRGPEGLPILIGAVIAAIAVIVAASVFRGQPSLN